MKKRLFFRLAFLCLVLQVMSCRKSAEMDKLATDEPLLATKTPKVPIPNCRIERIISNSGSDNPSTAEFKYNIYWNPTLVQLSNPSTGRPNLEFRYDYRNWLSDYIGRYNMDPDGGYEYWYNYQHDYNGRVIIDTGYLFGNIVKNIPQPNPMYKSYANYEYDNLDRVSKVTRTMTQNGNVVYTTVDEYKYDKNGNLINGASYDKQANFHQTNKIWQFIDRDYSRNNPAKAQSYNDWGYPLAFKTATPAWFMFGGVMDMRDSEIEYVCPPR